VSEPEDIFFIPIVIDVESLTVRSTLSEKEKKELIARLEQQSDKDIAEQLSYSYSKNPAIAEPFSVNTKYSDFVSKVKTQIKELLGRK